MGDIYKSAQGVLVWLGCLEKDLIDFLATYTKLRDKCVRWYGYASKEEMQKRVRKIGSKRCAELQRSKVAYNQLRYWNRMWIAQELLGPAEGAIFLFCGTQIHISGDMWPFLKCLDELELGTTKDSLLQSHLQPSHLRYLDWGRMVNGDISEAPKEDLRVLRDDALRLLASYLAHFDRAGCSDKRDRIYALLSLVPDVLDIKVDYTADTRDIFVDVLEKLMSASPIDALLRLGANLIQALDIRRPSDTHERKASTQKPYQIAIERPPSSGVASPIWAESTVYLATGKQGLEEPRESHATCIFVGIFDAQDFHVLEYAVEETPSEVTVKYARAHEYLRGQSRMERYIWEDRDMTDEAEFRFINQVFAWLDAPSEHTHYIRGPFEQYRATEARRFPKLYAWSSPEIYLDETLFECAPAGEREGQQPVLRPSMRYWNRFWGTGSGPLQDLQPEVFTSAKAEVERVVDLCLRRGGDDPDGERPQRASTVRLFTDVV
jgi:hypothetical protein